MEASDAISLEKQRERRRRVRRIKLITISSIICLIAFLLFTSIFLLVRTLTLQKKIDRLAEQVDEIALRLSEEEEGSQIMQEELLSDNETSSYVSQDYGKNPEDGSLLPYEESKEVQKVYLTFDDGPSNYTEQILDTLDEYGVKATFFVIGKTDEHSQAMYREIISRGHTLAMHSYSHRYSELYASKEAFVEDLVKEQDYLEEVTGVRPWLYRFPGGSSNRVGKISIYDLIEELKARDISYVDWNVSTQDAANSYLTESILLQNVEKDLPKYSDAVVLMHDTDAKAVTRDSLGKLIELIQGNGGEILPITKESILVQHVSAQ